MTFPVYFDVFGLRLHPHPVMEVIAYSGGFQLYLLLRRRWPKAAVPVESTLWLIVACVFGALFGAKLLAWLESFPLHRDQNQLLALISGKTIVGGLLGGWIGIEIAKKHLGIRHSTGDAFVFPLIFGIAVGRIGCFLTGLADHTHGIASSLPWAVDFGDAISRHPTQLYEVFFLLVLGITLYFHARRTRPNGELFRLFLASYLAFRFSVEFIKPSPKPYLHLSAIQWASLCGLTVCIWQIANLRHLSSTGEPIHERTAPA